ncbi:MAG: LolA family protein [Phycisphaerae bacterium]
MSASSVYALVIVAVAQVASGSDAPARKLVAAAWRKAPARLDVTYYLEYLRPAEPEAELRRSVERVFEHPDGSPLTLAEQEMVDTNVRRILAEQSGPRRIVKRLRLDNGRWRADSERLDPGAELGPGIALTETIVTVPQGTREGYRVFKYEGGACGAIVEPDTHQYAVSVGPDDWLGLPPPARTMAQVTFGKKNPAGEGLVPDEEKIRQFPVGGAGPFEVRVLPASAGRARVEFASRGGPTLAMMVCDEDDYGRVYRFEGYRSATGRLTMLREAGGFDANGFPAWFRSETYDEQGVVREFNDVTILKADPNPAFSEDVFEFRPPAGYAILDARVPPAQTLAQRAPDAVPTGETLGQILGGAPLPALVRPPKRPDVRIELPGSRPATQPAAANGTTTQPAGGRR